MLPRIVIVSMVVLVSTLELSAESRRPVYLWLEPEWFSGVDGYCEYHGGPDRLAEVHGRWGIAGPGISAEWTQGGESESNSIAAGPRETAASCQREIVVPRDGKYRVWVRYYDHRLAAEPFAVRIEQDGKPAIAGELGVEPVVPANDEYSLYWGFSFGWGFVEGTFIRGAAVLKLLADKPCEKWRQIDAVLITDDLDYHPIAREKPPFAHFDSYRIAPDANANWRGALDAMHVDPAATRKPLGGRDFAMWTCFPAKWTDDMNAKADSMSLYDGYFQLAPPEDILKTFHAQFAGRKDVPVMSWPALLPGFRLGFAPDLSESAPLRRWIDHNGRSPFFIMTNNSGPAYTAKSGPATYAELNGPMSDRFMGYINGESIGTEGVRMPDKPLGATRREHVDALGKYIAKKQAEEFGKFYQTSVDEKHVAKSISCLSVDSMAMAHLFHEMGCETVGYEVDSTCVNVPMRIAFERGAARQYGGKWINYASGNFGDACNYFTQEPQVPRGARSWFHSKYAITDGVSAAWYRKMYYLNYLSGASAILWEQGLTNQYLMPGPDKNPIDLSPFGRATVDFQSFVDRLGDRGEPLTPIAFLVSYGNSFERMHYRCKMLGLFPEDANDRELREMFNACWYPTGLTEGAPAAPDVQSMPNGVYGNIFDVLVDRPQRMKVISNYPVIIAAGDVDLSGDVLKAVREYVEQGGTLVVNVSAIKGNLAIAPLLGIKPTDDRQFCEQWQPDGQQNTAASSPYEVERATLAGAKAIVWAKAGEIPLITRNVVGKGAVIVTLVPHMLALDERAHPALPYLLNGLTRNLLPIEIDGARGRVMYQVNKTKDGYLVALFNNLGIDKTQHGIARVDRQQFVDVTIKTKLKVRSAKEFTQPREIRFEPQGDVLQTTIRVHPGDVQVVGLMTE